MRTATTNATNALYNTATTELVNIKLAMKKDFEAVSLTEALITAVKGASVGFAFVTFNTTAFVAGGTLAFIA